MFIIMLKLCMSLKIFNLWFSNHYYSMETIDKFINYVFPIDKIKINYNNESPNIKIWDTQDFPDENNFINVHLCIENCYHFQHYEHYNKFSNYKDPNIDIYFYNHIDKLVITDKYISIPFIYSRINYFKRFYKIIKPQISCEFSKKKFCLFATNKMFRNIEKDKIRIMLRSIGECDDLNSYKL